MALAIARFGPDGLILDELVLGRRGQDFTAELARRARVEPTLIGLDAPLGWPAPFVEAIADHRLGEPLGPPERPGHELFRRVTDRAIHARLGKLPLEVAADRIARAAWSTLQLLASLRERTGLAWPVLVSDPADDSRQATAPNESAVIEIYPAATLAALGLQHRGLKGAAGRSTRSRLLDELDRLIRFDASARALAVESDHAFDALVAAIATADFAAGRALAPPPESRTVAAREGWIQVRAGAEEAPET